MPLSERSAEKAGAKVVHTMIVEVAQRTGSPAPIAPPTMASRMRSNCSWLITSSSRSRGWTAFGGETRPWKAEAIIIEVFFWYIPPLAIATAAFGWVAYGCSGNRSAPYLGE